MAAAQAGKRKAQSKRRQKLQKGKPQAAPRQGKQPKQKPAGKALNSSRVRKGQEKKGVPTRYASKMLQQMRKVRMSAKAKGLMKSFMADLYSQVSSQAEQLQKQKQLPALGSTEVRAALEQVMPREVAKLSAAPVGNESA